MLSGTPVAATRLGAVPEIIEEGVTGVTAPTASELVTILPDCLKLDRARIRQEAERRFSASQMARDYLQVYQKIQRPSRRK